MITQAMLDYIKQQLGQGVNKEEIRNALINIGWQTQDIQEGFNKLERPAQSEQVPPQNIQPQTIYSSKPQGSPFQPRTVQPPTDSTPQSQSQQFQPQIISSVSRPAAVSPSKSRGKKLLFLIIGLLVIGGGAGGYYYYFEPFQTPEKVFQKMLTGLTEIKSFQYTGGLKVKINNINLNSLNRVVFPINSTSSLATSTLSTSTQTFSTSTFWSLFGINSNSVNSTSTNSTSTASTNSASTPESQINTNGKPVNSSLVFSGALDFNNLNNLKLLSNLNLESDILSDLSPQSKILLGLEIRTIDKNIYLKVSNFSFGVFDLFLYGLKPIVENKWISVGVNSQSFQEGYLWGVEEGGGKLTSDEIAKIKATSPWDIFKITEKLPDEKIEEVNTYHYKFLLDINKLLGRNIEAVGQVSGEIWIGKKDKRPYKLSLTIPVKEIAGLKSGGEVTFVSLFKNFNAPVQVEIPSEVKTLEEIFGELFMSSGTSASSTEF